MQPSLGYVPRVVTHVEKRIERSIGYENYIATTSTVTSRWTTSRDKLLTPESSNPVTSVTALDVNLGSINEHLNQNDAREHICCADSGVVHF